MSSVTAWLGSGRSPKKDHKTNGMARVNGGGGGVAHGPAHHTNGASPPDPTASMKAPEGHSPKGSPTGIYRLGRDGSRGGGGGRDGGDTAKGTSPSSSAPHQGTAAPATERGLSPSRSLTFPDVVGGLEKGLSPVSDPSSPPAPASSLPLQPPPEWPPSSQIGGPIVPYASVRDEPGGAGRPDSTSLNLSSSSASPSPAHHPPPSSHPLGAFLNSITNRTYSPETSPAADAYADDVSSRARQGQRPLLKGERSGGVTAQQFAPRVDSKRVSWGHDDAGGLPPARPANSASAHQVAPAPVPHLPRRAADWAIVEHSTATPPSGSPSPQQASTPESSPPGAGGSPHRPIVTLDGRAVADHRKSPKVIHAGAVSPPNHSVPYPGEHPPKPFETQQTGSSAPKQGGEAQPPPVPVMSFASMKLGSSPSKRDGGGVSWLTRASPRGRSALSMPSPRGHRSVSPVPTDAEVPTEARGWRMSSGEREMLLVERDSLRTESERLKGDRDRVTEERNRLRERAERADGEKKALAAEVRRLEDECARVREEGNMARGKQEGADSLAYSLDTEVRKLRESEATMASQVKELEAALSAAVSREKDAAERADASARQLGETAEAADRQRAALEEARRHYELQRHRSNILRALIVSSKDTEMAARAQSASSATMLSGEEAPDAPPGGGGDAAKLWRTVADQRGQITDLEGRCEAAAREVEEGTRRAEEAESRAVDLANRLALREAEAEDARRMLQGLGVEAGLEGVELALEEARGRAGDLEGRLREAEGEVARLREVAESLEAQLGEQRSRAEEAEGRASAESEGVERVRDEIAAREEVLKKEADMARQEVYALQAKLGEAQKAISDAKSKEQLTNARVDLAEKARREAEGLAERAGRELREAVAREGELRSELKRIEEGAAEGERRRGALEAEVRVARERGEALQRDVRAAEEREAAARGEAAERARGAREQRLEEAEKEGEAIQVCARAMGSLEGVVRSAFLEAQNASFLRAESAKGGGRRAAGGRPAGGLGAGEGERGAGEGAAVLEERLRRREEEATALRGRVEQEELRVRHLTQRMAEVGGGEGDAAGLRRRCERLEEELAAARRVAGGTGGLDALGVAEERVRREKEFEAAMSVAREREEDLKRRLDDTLRDYPTPHSQSGESSRQGSRSPRRARGNSITSSSQASATSNSQFATPSRPQHTTFARPPPPMQQRGAGPFTPDRTGRDWMSPHSASEQQQQQQQQQPLRVSRGPLIVSGASDSASAASFAQHPQQVSRRFAPTSQGEGRAVTPTGQQDRSLSTSDSRFQPVSRFAPLNMSASERGLSTSTSSFASASGAPASALGSRETPPPPGYARGSGGAAGGKLTVGSLGMPGDDDGSSVSSDNWSRQTPTRGLGEAGTGAASLRSSLGAAGFSGGVGERSFLLQGGGGGQHPRAGGSPVQHPSSPQSYSSPHVPSSPLQHPNTPQGSVGVGLALAESYEEGSRGVYVHSLVPGRSAALSGAIQRGSLVVSVDGHTISGLTLPEIRNRISGLDGTQVTLRMAAGSTGGLGGFYDVTLRRGSWGREHCIVSMG